MFPQARGDELAEQPLAVEDLLDLGDPLECAGPIQVGRDDVIVMELDGVESELVVRSGHSTQGTPQTIEEVRRILYEHAGILECAVIGVPDALRGEEVVAVVVPKSGVELDPEEVKAFASERLATFRVPTRIEVKGELPKTPTGKISKGPLREQFGHWATTVPGAGGRAADDPR